MKRRVILAGITPLVVLLIALCCVPSGPRAATGAPPAVANHPTTPRAETAHATVVIDYPEDGSIFPPGITPPTFLWRDGSASDAWEITVTFGDHAAPVRVVSHGERMKIGAIDPRCVGPTNELPKLTEKQAAAWTWKPDAATWAAIQAHSVKTAATFTVRGLRDGRADSTAGHIAFTTSTDAVGAPIFYRDVPLMPSANTEGVVQPLAADAIHLINWRLRDIRQGESHTVLTDVPTCLNCHSFALNGKTMGIDLDGPNNDKGLYALAPIQKRISVESKNVVQWNTDGKVGKIRVGFMTQVSPDGKYVVSTFSGASDLEFAKTYFVRNFTNYKFLQAFFPTKGILEYYNRAEGRRYPLPGADDPKYVQTGGVWSPDGKWIVFARALAKEPMAPGQKTAEYSGDPNETQIQYDLYRIPFNDGKGGVPERIVGASQNGMSNSFPKVSPDGKWIVFVEAKNAEIMRPDSQLYIVPFGGGVARRLRSNQATMNSWHSWSPNGKWLVFSSKGRGPYTQMYLTHMDAEGNASPAILVDNTTASNRAVNLPEFVNIPGDGIEDIALPAVDIYRLTEKAVALEEQKEYDQALDILKKAVTLAPDDAKVHNDLAADLYLKGDVTGAIGEVRDALDLNPALVQGHFNLAAFLLQEGHPEQALPEIEKALDLNPHFPQGEETLADTFDSLGRYGDALAHWRKALERNPQSVMAMVGAARILASSPDEQLRDGAEAVKLAGRANELTGGRDAGVLDTLGAAYAEAGQFDQALAAAQRALDLATVQGNNGLEQMISSRMVLYREKRAYRN